MDRHLSTVCPKLNPDAPVVKPKNVCQERRCKTKMIVPIACTDCRREFCAKHRYGKDHNCAGKPSSNAQGLMGSQNCKIVNTTRDYVSSSGIAALRRAQQIAANAKKSGHGSGTRSSGPTTAPLGSSANPLVLDSDSDSDVQIIEPSGGKSSNSKSFSDKSRSKQTLTGLGLGSKTDKRALAEQESARKALEARAKKG